VVPDRIPDRILFLQVERVEETEVSEGNSWTLEQSRAVFARIVEACRVDFFSVHQSMELKIDEFH